MDTKCELGLNSGQQCPYSGRPARIRALLARIESKWPELGVFNRF